MSNSPKNKILNEISFISEKDDKRKSSFFSYFIEEGKIEKNIKIIEKEIKKYNYSLDQRCFIENIIKLLDDLSKVYLFNKKSS